MGFRRYEVGSYEEMRARHSWDVPERYNIARDVCDKHDARPAGDGLGGLAGHRAACELRRAAGPVEPLRQRARGARRRARRPRGDAAAVAAGDRRRLPRHLQARRDPALDVGALRRRRHPAPADATRGASVVVTDATNRDRIPDGMVEQVFVLGGGARRGRRRSRRGDGRRRDATRSPTPPPTTRRSSTTRRARPARRRASCTPTATCSPTRSSSSATTCSDGELFHGSGEWAWAAGIAPLLGPVALRRRGARAGAQGRLRPRGAPALPRPSTGWRTCSRRRRRCAR